MEYRDFLNHRPSPVRGIEISGHALLARRLGPVGIASSASLRTGDGAFACYDQGNLGSCTANAVAGAVRFVDPTVLMSRLYNYYYARALIGTINSDSGAYVSDAANVTKTKGIPQETTWPYDISKFKQKPPSAADTDALSRKTTTIQALSNTVASIKAAVAGGYPVIIGFTVYTSMFSDNCLTTGNIPMPSGGESVEGGHCVCVWGYDDGTSKFLIRNSWGTGVGDDGFFYMPYAYYAAYGFDPWVISDIGSPTPPTLSIGSSTINIRPSTYNSNFTITNRDSIKSTISIKATSSPKGLTLSLTKSSVKLDSEASTTVGLRITANNKAANKTYTITLTAKSATSNLTTTTTLTVVVASLRLSIPPVIRFSSSTETISVGTTRQFGLTVQNIDGTSTVFNLETILPYGFTGRITPSTLTLPPSSTQTASLEVTVPPAGAGSYAIIVAGSDKSTGLKSGGGFLLTAE